MNREQIIGAIESDQAFSIRMADGREYEVPHKEYISLPPKGAFVMVYDDQGHAYMLPLLMIAGIMQKA